MASMDRQAEDASAQDAKSGAEHVETLPIGCTAGVAIVPLWSIALVVFTGVMLPSSGPPSEWSAVISSFWFWLAGAIAFTVASIVSSRSLRYALAIWIVTSGVLLLIAQYAGARFERARFDSCLWGQGGGDQPWCTTEQTELADVRLSWLAAAACTALLVGMVALIGVRSSARSERNRA